MVTLAVGFDENGRLHYGNGDIGLVRSENEYLDSYKRIDFPYNSNPTTNVANKEEASTCMIRSNWRGSGVEAVFVIAGGCAHATGTNKILMRHPSVNSGDWYNLDQTGSYAGCHFKKFVMSDDNSIFAIYDADPGDVSSPIYVCRAIYDGQSWGFTSLADPDYNGIATDIVYTPGSDRVFMSQRSPAKILVLTNSGQTNWQVAYSNSGVTGVMCLDALGNGQTLYGGLYKAGDDLQVVACFNGHVRPALMTWYDVPVTINFAAGIYFNTIAIDPNAPWVFYVGINRSDHTDVNNGLWEVEYNGILGTADWRDVLNATPYRNIGIRSMAFSSANPDLLVIGTSGYEVLTLTQGGNKSGIEKVSQSASAINRLRAVQDGQEGGIISFRPGLGGLARVDIYDIRGRRVRTIEREATREAECRVVWNGRDSLGRTCASGVYLIKVFLDNEAAVTRLAIVR